MKKILVIFILLSGMGLHPAAAQSVSTAYDQGLALYAQGQYPRAVKKFQKALKTDGHRWQVLQALGDCWLKLQDADKALDYYRQSLKLHPDNPTLEYYVSSQQTVFNPNLKAPQPGEGNKPARGIDLSFTFGEVYLFQPSILEATTDNPCWQASFYFGIQPSPDWACGLQLDYLSFAPSGIDPSAQLTWMPGQSSQDYNNFATSCVAGNLSVNLKVYPFSATSPFPVYLVGGGGLFVIQRGILQANSYVNSGSTITSTYAVIPATLQAGPSMDGGVGVAYKIDDNARVLTEFRAVNVFLAQPIAYGTLNVGVLYLF